MLLQRLNDFATSRKLLDNLAFRPKAVRWIITLDDAGNLVGQGPVETVGERNRGKEFDCPQTTRPKVAGGVAEFLADGITAVFGLDTNPEQPMSEKKRKDRTKITAANMMIFGRRLKRPTRQRSARRSGACWPSSPRQGKSQHFCAGALVPIPNLKRNLLGGSQKPMVRKSSWDRIASPSVLGNHC